MDDNKMRNLIAAVGLGIITLWAMFWLGVMYVCDIVIEKIEKGAEWLKRKQKKRT
jgi:hypothetical protein